MVKILTRRVDLNEACRLSCPSSEISEKIILGKHDINYSAATAGVYSWALFCALKCDTEERASRVAYADRRLRSLGSSLVTYQAPVMPGLQENLYENNKETQSF